MKVWYVTASEVDEALYDEYIDGALFATEELAVNEANRLYYDGIQAAVDRYNRQLEKYRYRVQAKELLASQFPESLVKSVFPCSEEYPPTLDLPNTLNVASIEVRDS